MNLRLGVLAGTRIWGHQPTNRDEVVAQINRGEIDGVVMTERVGGCGFSITGANHVIYLGSSYSQTMQDQVICTSPDRNMC
jgi:SNF2 family DNA or RNA helicase